MLTSDPLASRAHRAIHFEDDSEDEPMATLPRKCRASGNREAIGAPSGRAGWPQHVPLKKAGVPHHQRAYDSSSADEDGRKDDEDFLISASFDPKEDAAAARDTVATAKVVVALQKKLVAAQARESSLIDSLTATQKRAELLQRQVATLQASGERAEAERAALEASYDALRHLLDTTLAELAQAVDRAQSAESPAGIAADSPEATAQAEETTAWLVRFIDAASTTASQFSARWLK